MTQGDRGPVHAGILWLRRDHEDDLVEVSEVTEAARRDAPDNLCRLLLPRLCAGERPHRAPDGIPLAPWAMRLSRLARSARRTLGDADWLVEWDDDGHRCRPHRARSTTPPRTWQDTLVRIDPNATLTLPGVFGAELAGSAVDLLFDRWHQHLPVVPASRPLLVGRRAQVYLNATLVTDLLRRVGLPTRAAERWLTTPDSPTRSAAVVAGMGHHRVGRLWRAVPALARAGLLSPAQAVATARQDLARAVERATPVPGRTLPPADAALCAVVEATTTVLHAHAALLVTASLRSRYVRSATPERLVEETARATRALRAGWLARADRTVATGRLPDREALWLLRPAEAERLLSSGRFSADPLLGRRRDDRRRSSRSRAEWLAGEVPSRGPRTAVERAPDSAFVHAYEEEGSYPSS